MLMPRFLLCSCRNSFLTDLVYFGGFCVWVVFSSVCLGGGGGHVVLAVEVGGVFLFIVLGGFLAK